MISKERFDLLTEYAKLTSSYYTQRIEKGLVTFNFDSLKIADEIYRNKDSYDTNKWFELYNTYKSDYSLLMPIITFGGDKLPEYVFEEILQNIVEAATLRDPSSLKGSKYNTYEKEIAFECVKHTLSDVALNTLFDILSINALISRYYDIDSYSSAKKVLQIPDSNTNKIAIKCAAEYVAPKKIISYTHRPLQNLSPVLWVKDIDILNDMIYNRTGYEQNCIASAVISSRVLDQNDPKVQDLFSETLSSCDPILLDRYPDCITEDLSIMMHLRLQDHLSHDFRICNYKTIDPVTGEEKNEYMDFFDMLTVIEKLCNKEKIASSVEVDFANRIIDAKIREENSFAVSLFSHTSNPTIIPLIDNLLSHNKISVYDKGKYIPPEMITKRAEEFCTKIDKFQSKGEEGKIADVWFDYISTLSTKATLSDECYNTILNNLDQNKMAIEVASQSLTPDWVLEKMITCSKDCADGSWRYYGVDKISTMAKINLLCRKNNIGQDIISLIKTAVNTSLFNLAKDENINRGHDATYGIQRINSITSQYFEDAKKLLALMDNFLNEDLSSNREKVFFERLKETLEEDINKKNKEIEGKEVDIDCQLHHYSLAFANALFSSTSIYVELPQILEHYDKYYTMVQNRIKNNDLRIDENLQI